jgi:hypothetical protein
MDTFRARTVEVRIYSTLQSGCGRHDLADRFVGRGVECVFHLTNGGDPTVTEYSIA